MHSDRWFFIHPVETFLKACTINRYCLLRLTLLKFYCELVSFVRVWQPEGRLPDSWVYFSCTTWTPRRRVLVVHTRSRFSGPSSHRSLPPVACVSRLTRPPSTHAQPGWWINLSFVPNEIVERHRSETLPHTKLRTLIRWATGSDLWCCRFSLSFTKSFVYVLGKVLYDEFKRRY